MVYSLFFPIPLFYFSCLFLLYLFSSLTLKCSAAPILIPGDGVAAAPPPRLLHAATLWGGGGGRVAPLLALTTGIFKYDRSLDAWLSLGGAPPPLPPPPTPLYALPITSAHLPTCCPPHVRLRSAAPSPRFCLASAQIVARLPLFCPPPGDDSYTGSSHRSHLNLSPHFSHLTPHPNGLTPHPNGGDATLTSVQRRHAVEAAGAR